MSRIDTPHYSCGNSKYEEWLVTDGWEETPGRVLGPEQYAWDASLG